MSGTDFEHKVSPAQAGERIRARKAAWPQFFGHYRTSDSQEHDEQDKDVSNPLNQVLLLSV